MPKVGVLGFVNVEDSRSRDDLAYAPRSRLLDVVNGCGQLDIEGVVVKRAEARSIILWATAIGLFVFGLFCLAESRYRRHS